jgi:hypothetical protein
VFTYQHNNHEILLLNCKFKYLLLFHCISGYANAPQSYVITYIAWHFQHSNSLRPKQLCILRVFSDWLIIWGLWPRSEDLNQWNFHFWYVFKDIVCSNLCQLVLVCSRICIVWPFLLSFFHVRVKYIEMLHQTCANCQISWSHLKIKAARTVNEDPQILGTMVQGLVSRTTWFLGI